MDDLMEKIARAKQAEIGEILSAVLLRYGELFPEWEISTISLKKSEDRNEQIDQTIRMLLQMKSVDE